MSGFEIETTVNTDIQWWQWALTSIVLFYDFKWTVSHYFATIGKGKIVMNYHKSHKLFEVLKQSSWSKIFKESLQVINFPPPPISKKTNHWCVTDWQRVRKLVQEVHNCSLFVLCRISKACFCVTFSIFYRPNFSQSSKAVWSVFTNENIHHRKQKSPTALKSTEAARWYFDFQILHILTYTECACQYGGKRHNCYSILFS